MKLPASHTARIQMHTYMQNREVELVTAVFAATVNCTKSLKSTAVACCSDLCILTRLGIFSGAGAAHACPISSSSSMSAAPTYGSPAASIAAFRSILVTTITREVVAAGRACEEQDYRGAQVRAQVELLLPLTPAIKIDLSASTASVNRTFSQ